MVAGLVAARGSLALQARDGEWRALRGRIWRAGASRLPLVRELSDPVALGVHPAATLDAGRGGRCPRFISRQFGAALALALLRDRFVLLVGESTAGKSRAAYELIRAELPGHRLVQPACREAAQLAAECAATNTRTVLWLDDLERFLGSGGLTGAAVRDVLEAGGARYIVATMRSEEYARFSGRAAAGPDAAGRDALRQGWDVLRLATRIDVPRMWSAEEIARARQVPGDPRLDEAARHAAEYGVAEYLAAAPQLLAEWRSAWAPGTHPRAAAMVMAAVDARRAGLHRPLQLTTLLELHEPYLRRRGGARLRPEDTESAVAWATAPLYATSSLLIPADGGFLAFDYLIDAAEQDRVPAAALNLLTEVATPGEALDIGQLAWSWSLVSQADTAFRHAEAGGLFQATALRCFLIGSERAGDAAALDFARQAAEWTTAVFGPDHPQTLDACALVASQTRHAGDPAAALRLYKDLAARSENLLGPDHEVTLRMRQGSAAMTGDLGDQTGAALQYDQLAADYTRVLGEDHEATIICRNQAAMWTAEAGEPVRAVAMFRALITDMTERFRSPAADVFQARHQLAGSLTQAGHYQAALPEWEQLTAEAAATSGRLRSTSFYVRLQHAWCIGEAGDPQRAVSMLRQLVGDIAELDDPQLIHHLFARRSLAWWTGEAGDPAEAERQLSALIEEAAAQRGNNDPRVKALRLMHAHWTAMNGPPDQAHSRLQLCADQLSRELGPGHEITRASRRELLRQRAAAAAQSAHARRPDDSGQAHQETQRQ
jgi:hypothetical protein